MLALGFLALALSLYDTRDELRRISLSLQAEEIAHDFQTHDFLDKLPRYYADGEMSYSLYNAQGGLLQISDNLDSPRRLRPSRPEDELALFKLPQRSGNIVSVSVTLSNGDILMVAKRDERERELIGALLQARMWRSLMLWLPFCALGLLLITWLVHWTLRPVRQAAELAATLGPAQPELRLPVSELPTEIRPLAHAVNQSLDRRCRLMSTNSTWSLMQPISYAHPWRSCPCVCKQRLKHNRKTGICYAGTSPTSNVCLASG
ncbi:HAMP domain-containing protein [Alcaligenes faecalis]|uniref:histidine kinase n=1 Tax=Alcaligenes faecalis TaxID=511 RepID=A0ABY7N142_ALCFA|nr:HAMP domain-containing protein [Alcaligenes faecalis]WBM37796.1 HAMP domain-containing protein [Alcaligenes faecalis]